MGDERDVGIFSNFDTDCISDELLQIHESVHVRTGSRKHVVASEYNFHPTQKGKWNEDGSYTLTFKASGEWEIITEILKWRDSVKIIAPKKLKDIYFETVEKMYQNIMKG